jgi:DNA-binding CsgD family transcriptional regulator
MSSMLASGEDTAVGRGRESFARHAWGSAYVELSAAAVDAPLGGEDLERLATAAHLLGRDSECEDAWAGAQRAFQVSGDVERAARSAFWLAFLLLDRGAEARASGWLARARRLLGAHRESVEQGYLLFPEGLRCFGAGDYTSALDAFHRTGQIAERFGDRDLAALAYHGEGRALLRQGATPEGLALLDEAMVAVTVGDLSPIVAGDVYCGVISACHEIFDIRRAREWTAALARWCASHPDMVSYRGQCLVRRAEILQLQGAWSDALDEACRACEWLSGPPGRPGAGSAFYQRAELHRLRGELAQAEAGYREAGRLGRRPQPGLALLRLARGEVEGAVSMLREALEEARERRARPRLLGAAVEAFAQAGDLAAAREAADELSRIARDLSGPFLAAMAAHAGGAVLLAERDAAGALRRLREAWSSWSSLDAPYEAGRAGVLIAAACLQLGDGDTARTELEAARAVFERLEAAPDLQVVARVVASPRRSAADGLSVRELEVLGLVATGRTNRSIAAELHISEKTVARHLSNIFTKLGLSTRAAAAAYAFRHHLA